MKKIDGFDFPSRHLTEAQFSSIALSRHPSGPLAVVDVPKGWDAPSLPAQAHIGRKVLVLEDIQDPGNIGSLVRSAAAFDFSGIIFTEKCADPFGPKAVQASCGAIVSLWLRRTHLFRVLLKTLKEEKFRFVAADTKGVAGQLTCTSTEKLAIILGNEGNGLSDEMMRQADDIIKIPFNEENVESLNVAACGAILMHRTLQPVSGSGSLIPE